MRWCLTSILHVTHPLRTLYITFDRQCAPFLVDNQGVKGTLLAASPDSDIHPAGGHATPAAPTFKDASVPSPFPLFTCNGPSPVAPTMGFRTGYARGTPASAAGVTPQRGSGSSAGAGAEAADSASGDWSEEVVVEGEEDEEEEEGLQYGGRGNDRQLKWVQGES
jgi:hypothetical protein